MLTDRKADAKVHEVVVGQPTVTYGSRPIYVGQIEVTTNVMTIVSCVTSFKEGL